MILQNPFTIYLTPVSLTFLSVSVPSIALILYLFTIKNKSISTKWIIAALSMGAAAIILVGWRESLPNPHPTWVVLSNLALLFGVGTLAMLMQHGYHHPSLLPAQHFEARFVLYLSLASILILGCAWLWPLPHFYTASLIILSFYVLLWNSIYIRKIYYYAAEAGVDNWREIWLFPKQPLLRSFRIFSLITMSPLLVIGVLIWHRTFPVNSFLFVLSLSGTMALFLFVGMFALINHLVEPTNLLYKLTSMAFVLLFLLAGATTYITYSLLNTHYLPTPTIANGQRYRFTREAETTYHLYSVNETTSINNAGSVNNIEAVDEGQPAGILPAGIPLERDQNQVSPIDLDFSFPFYEHTWQKLWVSEDGHVSFIAPLIRDAPQDAPQKSGIVGVPFIAPLLVDLNPLVDSDVYIDKTDDFITITWYKFRTAPNTNFPDLAATDDEASTTVSLTLWATGDIEFSYPQVNLHRTYISDMSLHSWLVGISPGAAANVKPLRFTPALDTQSDGSVSLLQNFQTEAMIYSHSWLAPFALLYIAAGFFILLGFPLFLRSTLIAPVSRLMKNVERVDGGDLSVETEIQSHDEIGFLTDAFNRMVASIRTSQSELAKINTTLEERIEERTEELALARDEAQLANQAKSQFLANMSHELRTPLNAILGYAQILQQQLNLGRAADLPGNLSTKSSTDESLHKNGSNGMATMRSSQRPPEHGLQVIQQSGEHLLAMLNDILDLSRIEAGKETVSQTLVPLHSFVRQSVGMTELQAQEKGLTLTYDIAPNLPEQVELDERLIRQVLINLLHNAVKFTDEGSITLSVTAGELSSMMNERTSSGQDGSERVAIRFAVQDTGKGIVAHELENVFGAFEQVAQQNGKRNGSGVGLGLAISQQLLQQMNSFLQVESMPSKGSRFWFDLPVNVYASGMVSSSLSKRHNLKSFAVESSGHLSGYSGPRHRILIVDDNVQNRAVLEEMLGILGFDVFQASNGHEGVRLALELLPALIFMDLVMPEMDGVSAVRAMRMEPTLHDTVIIAASASVLEADVKLSHEIGCDDFLPKPIKLQRLHDLLEKHLNLEWTYVNHLHESIHNDTLNPETSRVINEGSVFAEAGLDSPINVPPRDDLASLYEMVLAGDIGALRHEIAALQQTKPEYAPFIEPISTYLRTYQMNAIQALIEKHLSPGVAPHDRLPF